MDNKTGIFKLVDGLKPVDSSKLAAFEQVMTEETIPNIIMEVEKRRMLAADSRQRRLETPTTDKSESPK